MSARDRLLKLWKEVKDCNACPRKREYIPWTFPERRVSKAF